MNYFYDRELKQIQWPNVIFVIILLVVLGMIIFQYLIPAKSGDIASDITKTYDAAVQHLTPK